MVQAGRAVLYPIYKGTFERKSPLLRAEVDRSALYKDHVIMWSKDLSRSIDYLEGRSDIDHDKIGYYGYSWGGSLGAILPAVERRIKVSLLSGAGLSGQYVPAKELRKESAAWFDKYFGPVRFKEATEGEAESAPDQLDPANIRF